MRPRRATRSSVIGRRASSPYDRLSHIDRQNVPGDQQNTILAQGAVVTTAWRAVKATTAPERRAIAKAVAKTREVVWRAAPQGDITIDFDATLLDVHSEKQDAAPTYKRGYRSEEHTSEL